MRQYVFVRTDLHSKQYIAVQAAHSAFEAAKEFNHKVFTQFDKPTYEYVHPTIIILAVDNLAELKKARKKVERKIKKRTKSFYEADLEEGDRFTSFCVEPVTHKEKELFMDFELLDLDRYYKKEGGFLNKLLDKFRKLF